jgi:hypothetical protein
MRIAGRQLGRVRIRGDANAGLTAAQSTALLTAVFKDAPVSWTANTEVWTLSTKGANAVLLKMTRSRAATTPRCARSLRKQTGILSHARPPLPELVAARLQHDKPDLRLPPAQQRPAMLPELRATLGKETRRAASTSKKPQARPGRYRCTDGRTLSCWYRSAVRGCVYRRRGKWGHRRAGAL